MRVEEPRSVERRPGILLQARGVWYDNSFTDSGWAVSWGHELRCLRGNNSVVECDLAKVEVAGSNPVSRSIFC
jgi:hypothetical protein